MKRFLEYSLYHQRMVRAVFMQGGVITERNIRVTALEENRVVFTVSGKKTPIELPVDDILSVSYARGDSGEG
ncbi:MAG: hypothetical protein PHI27_01310 [Eubacteriales bacterium]|nr:hypothetical protein [Eubacteriales bacterium]MDD3880873.1 hypothetical protein [Eubacteriales bacterium]MDD4511760.1 hypothetical protein [Eubacteriales bacterium]